MATSTDHMKLTKRYTAALFELAGQRKKITEVSKDLAVIATTIKSSDTLATAINNPTISASELTNMAAALAKKAKLGNTTSEFLQVLATNKRLVLVTSIAAAFDQLVRESKGENVVEITSAKKLSKKDKDQLSKQLGKGTKFNESVDESLLAGFVLQSGSRMLDASLKGKLERMRVHLTSK